MKRTLRATVSVPRPIDEVFDFSVALANFPGFLRPVFPIPGITKIEMLEGASAIVGATRRVTMTDASSLREVILELTRPHKHRYRWLDPPKAPFSFMVRGGEGEWTFTPVADATEIEWLYHFELAAPVLLPLTSLVFVLFRRWMQRGLENIRTNMAATGT